MKTIFSARNRSSTWRSLWIDLAEAEKELGIADITDEAIKQMKEHRVMTDKDFVVAAEEEKRSVNSCLYVCIGSFANGSRKSQTKTRCVSNRLKIPIYMGNLQN